MKPVTITDFEDELVNHFRDIAISMKKDDEEKFMGWIEFNNALANNVYFSKKNRDSNGFQYSIENTPSLFDWLTNFKTVNYQLNDNVSIRLTPKGFFHILFGHVEGYLIPRKGAMVKIININSCEELFKLISDIIMHIKTDLINHYQAKLGKFEKNNIIYSGHEYALNIDSKRKIISFYSVERKFIKNYN